MNKLPYPKHIIRTTLGEFSAHAIPQYSGPGVYVIASYPSWGCLYIGKSIDIAQRMYQHCIDKKPLGNFIRDNFVSSCGFRLDIHVPPDEVDENKWLYEVEIALIQYFHPYYNEMLYQTTNQEQGVNNERRAS